MAHLINEGYSNASTLISYGNGSNVFINKKRYLDLSFCAGTYLLGHNSKTFQKAIIDLKNKKISNFASPNVHAENFAKTLKKIIPSYSKFVLCNSGTEAVTKGIRICRAITKKNLILSINGSWHGSVDETLYSYKKRKKKKLSDGLYSDGKKILFANYNNFKETKKILKKYKSKICCILIEPVQACLPNENSKEYLVQLANYAKKENILLFFDEMITGLRTDGKTVQQEYGISPDISTFGKSYGGGMPIGFIGINKKMEKRLKKNKVFFGGTFSGNSISMFIANETLKYIIKNKSKIFKKINFLSDKFTSELNDYFLKNNYEIKVFRFKSMMRLVFSNKQIQNRIQRDFLEKSNLPKIKLFKNLLLKNRVYYPNNGTIFFSYSTSLKDVRYLIKIIKKIVDKIYA